MIIIFTDNLIIARTYAYNTSDHMWLEDKNDKSVISYDVVIDIKQKKISIKRFPNEFRGLNIKRISILAKEMEISFNQMFEKHVGIETDTITLNKYSVNPTQLRKWIEGYFIARNNTKRSRTSR